MITALNLKTPGREDDDEAVDESKVQLDVYKRQVYDVPSRAEDHAKLDESEEVYEYLLCALCPVELSKPGLGYHCLLYTSSSAERGAAS